MKKEDLQKCIDETPDYIKELADLYPSSFLEVPNSRPGLYLVKEEV